MNICFKSRTMDLSWSLAVWAYRETKNEKLAWVFARSVEQTFKKEKAQTSNEQKSVAPIVAANLSFAEIRDELFLRFLKEVWETNEYVYNAPTLSQRRKLNKSLKSFSLLDDFKLSQHDDFEDKPDHKTN